MSTQELFSRAAAGFRARLEKASDWSAATPCTEWDLRALVNHVQYEICWIPPLVDGKTIADVGDSLDGDLIGDDALKSWDTAVAAVEASIAPAGALERTVHLSSGDTDADEYVRQVTSDITIHTWDLARAIGADERLEPDLVSLTMDTFGPMMEGARNAGVFGPEVPVAGDADPQTKLLALSGRTP